MKTARITCPNCGHCMTVRAIEPGEVEIPPEHAKKMWEAVDAAFAAADRAMRATADAFRHAKPVKKPSRFRWFTGGD